jgi:hypothetical protein
MVKIAGSRLLDESDKIVTIFRLHSSR